MLVEGPLSSMLLLANENKLGHKTIKKMKIIAVAAKRGFKFFSVPPHPIPLPRWGEGG